MEGTRRPLKSMCARTQSCVYFILSPEFSLQVASSTWTTNMLRLDPTFNADLPESKRWLKEYGARENEAFRYFFLYCTSQCATFYEGYKTCVILLLFNSTTIAESTPCQPRRATDGAPWRTRPSSSSFDIHLTDQSLPTLTRYSFYQRCAIDNIGRRKSHFLKQFHDFDFEYINHIQVADTTKEPNLLKHRDVKNAILAQVGSRNLNLSNRQKTKISCIS